jgi:hypothetical protein
MEREGAMSLSPLSPQEAAQRLAAMREDYPVTPEGEAAADAVIAHLRLLASQVEHRTKLPVQTNGRKPHAKESV